jgi:glycerol-3-phosphate acyltransferase PlsY
VDAGKGILAVILASLITSDRITPLAAMMAVTAGHIWPIQLGLGGGKGVATSLGGLLAWSPLLYTVFVGSFLLGFLVSRKATVSVVASYISLPLAAAIVGKTGIEVIALILLSAVIVYLHRGSMLLDLRAGGTT